MFGLEHLLGSVTLDEFYEKYWGKRAVIISGNEDRFSDVFSWNEVNHFLNYSRTSYDGMRLLLDKKELPRKDIANAKTWLEKGATLVINSVNQIDPVVGRFSSLIGRELNTQIHTNCYASYTSKQGFDTHFDEHDVFIIQVEGSKMWAVFEPTIQHPLHIQSLDKGNPPQSDPYVEYELKKGDVLYIPRGHWHHAVAVTPSVHLTVGPQSRSGIEYLQWAMTQLMHNDEFFRRDLPVAGAESFGGTRPDIELDEYLDTFKHRFLDIFGNQAFKESVVQYVMTSNEIASNWNLPVSWDSASAVLEETRFELHPEQKAIIRYDDQSKDAVVFVRGNRINLNGIPKSMLARIFESADVGFSLQEVLIENPELEEDKVRSVLTQLLDFSVLIVSDSKSANV